jgi:hypothetical protein
MALTYEEVEALGLCSARLLRKLVMIGDVQRSVLRAGRRVRFLRLVLIEELQQPKRRRGARR